MEINDQLTVEARTTLSPSIESRANSSIGSPASPQLQVFNPESQTVSEINPVKQKETQAKLHTPIQTIAKAASGKSLVSASLSDAHSLASKFSAMACFVAAFATKVLPKDSALLKTVTRVADASAKLAIAGVGTGRGIYDAIINGKPLIALAQVLNGVVSILVPTNQMTNARGAPIGFLNAFQASEMFENGKYAKVRYDGIGDHLNHQLQAWKAIAKQLRANPLAIFDLSQKGLVGAGVGGLMVLATTAYAVTRPISKTVSDWFAGFRDMLGAFVEVEGLKKVHFKEGRVNLISKSTKFSLGSVLNLLSKVNPANAKFFSLLNLGLNASGNGDQMDSFAMNEQNHIGKSVYLMNVVTNGLKSMVRFKSNIHEQLEKAQPVILKMEDQSPTVQAEVKKQVQAMNGHRDMSTSLGGTTRSSRSLAQSRTLSVAPAAVPAVAAPAAVTKAKTATPVVRAEVSRPIRQTLSPGISRTNLEVRRSTPPVISRTFAPITIAPRATIPRASTPAVSKGSPLLVVKSS